MHPARAREFVRRSVVDLDSTAAEPRGVVLRLRAEARQSARAAGLHYVDDARPGISRIRRGKHFSHVDPHGRVVRDRATLERIRKLAIPPAWTAVWICADALGHLQATGRDARGRKQYRYHPSWTKVRTDRKHQRICAFAGELPAVRAYCRRWLRRPGLARETVLAALIRIVDLTAIRVGNEEYTRQNASYGLTTLRRQHAQVSGNWVELRFRGKGGIPRRLRFRDARLARLVEDCRALRGKQLFHYVDEVGVAHPIHAAQLNAHLRSLTAAKYSIKDFRTWTATVDVAIELGHTGPSASEREARKAVVDAIRKAAAFLGNTATVCRNSYVDPVLLEAYLGGRPPPTKAGVSTHLPRRASARLAEERRVLHFLKRLSSRRSNGKVVQLKAGDRTKSPRIRVQEFRRSFNRRRWRGAK